MLHQGLGSATTSPPAMASPTSRRREASQRRPAPAYQGFEQATLNYVGNGSGYYSTREFEEILAYAAERHIEVIPEFDIPATRAPRSRRWSAATNGSRERSGGGGPLRLLDPDDTSEHASVQGYTDNFVNPCLESTYRFLDNGGRRDCRRRYDARRARGSRGEPRRRRGAAVRTAGRARPSASRTRTPRA